VGRRGWYRDGKGGNGKGGEGDKWRGRKGSGVKGREERGGDCTVKNLPPPHGYCVRCECVLCNLVCVYDTFTLLFFRLLEICRHSPKSGSKHNARQLNLNRTELHVH